jgi:formylglycine-generating enzyme required for sulfatase activity
MRQRVSKLTGKEFKLPTEAQWEYAVRAGSESKYHFGDEQKQFCTYANGADKTTHPDGRVWKTKADCSDGYVFTAPVGSYTANAYGLKDMYGNVWEWTADCWHKSYENAPLNGYSPWLADNKGLCTSPVFRGGSWISKPRLLRAAYRGRYTASLRYNNIGFRVLRAAL